MAEVRVRWESMPVSRTTRTICPSGVARRVLVISPPRSLGKAYFRLFESNSFTSKPQGTAFLTAIQIGSAWMLKVMRSPGGAYAWKTCLLSRLIYSAAGMRATFLA